MASFISGLEHVTSWCRSKLIWRVFFICAIVAVVVVRTEMDWCKGEKCGFIISDGQEDYSFGKLFPVAIIGVIGGLVGALFNQLTLYIITWRGNHLHKKGAGDSRCEGRVRIRYTRDQLLQLRKNAHAAPLFSGGASLFLPSAMGVVPMATYQASTSKKIAILEDMVGMIIGKGGETIKYLRLQSGAKIELSSEMEADPNSPNRLFELRGTPKAISCAEKLIHEILERQTDVFSMKIPNNKVGIVIGRGQKTIKNVQAWSGAQIHVIPLRLPPGDTSTERTLKIVGAPHQIKAAKDLVDQVITMPGFAPGKSQQSRVPRPPCSSCNSGVPPAATTAPPPPMQQNPAPSVDRSAYNFSQPPSSSYNHPGYGYVAYNAPPQSGYDSASYSYGSSNPQHEGGSSQIAIAQQGYGSNYQPQFGSVNGYRPPHWLPHSIFGHSQSASTAGGGYGHSATIYLHAAHPPPGFDGPPQALALHGNTTSSYGAGYSRKPSYTIVIANGRAPALEAPQQEPPQQGGVAKVKLH